MGSTSPHLVEVRVQIAEPFARARLVVGMHLTAIQKMGIETDRFQEATGTMTELA